MNLEFDTFFRLVNRILDKHAPTKIIEKKENKITSKPWIINYQNNYQNIIHTKNIGI